MQMNFSGSENRSEHTFSGRLIPVAEALYLAILKASRQPVFEPKYSTQLPAWCHNICDHFTKSIFRGLVEVAPKTTNLILAITVARSDCCCGVSAFG